MKYISKYYVTSILITSLLLSTNNVTATNKYNSYELYKQTETSLYSEDEFNKIEQEPVSITSLQVDLFDENQLDILEPLAVANKNLIEKEKEISETFEVSDVRESSILMVEVVELEEEEQEPTISEDRLVQLEELSISQADINAMYQMVEAEGGVCNYEEKLALANAFVNKTIYQRTATKGISIKEVLENPS